MMPKAAILPLLAAMISPISAQAPTEPASKPTQDKKPPYVVALENLRKADEAGREKALGAYIESQVATNAIYAGQYGALKKLEWDATPMLVSWITKPPTGIKTPRDNFSKACVNALRDCVDKPTDELKATLAKAAKDYLLAEGVRDDAKFALAQFGDRTHVDKMLDRAKKNTKAENITTKFRGWSSLANAYYQLRQYDDAANAHMQIIKMIEGMGRIPNNYYNCGCSLALAGKKDEAFKMVTKALEVAKKGAGMQMPKSLLLTDMDIQSLRGDPRYAELMKKFYGVTVEGKGKPAAGGMTLEIDKKSGDAPKGK